MSRYICKRCGATEFTTNPAHLCKDLRKRHERQAKAVARVVEVLRARPPIRNDDLWYETTALDIIKALSGRDLGVD